MLTALETNATIDANHQIVLDELLPRNTPSRVRVIILFDEDSDITEGTWLNTASKNDAFDFLNDEGEDIYSAADGVPFNNEK